MKEKPSGAEQSEITSRMRGATEIARHIVDLQNGFRQGEITTTCTSFAVEHVRKLSDESAAASLKKLEEDAETAAAKQVSLDRSNWRDNYVTWKAKLSADSMAPSDQQWLILDTIHERAKFEYEWERMEPNDSHAMAKERYKAHRQAEPLFRLIHGLPGSGKSKVLKWLRSYLVEVWHMTEEEDFVFLAPMNSMAAGIGDARCIPGPKSNG